MFCASMPRSEKEWKVVPLKLSKQASYSEPKAPSSIQNLQKADAHTVSFLELANNVGGMGDLHSVQLWFSPHASLLAFSEFDVV